MKIFLLKLIKKSKFFKKDLEIKNTSLVFSRVISEIVYCTKHVKTSL